MKRICFTAFIAPFCLLGLSSLTAADAPAGEGKVQGSMYFDANGNGKFDEGEQVPAKITLLVLEDGEWVPVEASFSVENGQFVFSGLGTGTYRVQFDFPGGITRATQSFVLTQEDPSIDVQIPFSRNEQGSIEIPTSYLTSGQTTPQSFVNVAAILGEEVSNFTP